MRPFYQQPLGPRLEHGGGVELAIELLPEEARAELVKRAGIVANTPQIPLVARYALPADQQARRDARLWVLNAVEDFARENGLKTKPASLMWAAAYNAVNIDAPAWVVARNAAQAEFQRGTRGIILSAEAAGFSPSCSPAPRSRFPACAPTLTEAGI